ncbi:PrsW family intramembrane metalloprotease [Secundilactobacillus folii]|uniref:PrsW family intramembrane metalloprotease n=1 Tax=Secundilactobacillus folii TaxID=2678357 RepID=A0A7X3C2Z3_9LACO|nr:PrsW family glutamic-type intramembrane protease [Secundilactobacillus folii]MTV82081.1 PrsW family intramembrane metalloprotease [Secundilactobacillus folii]
MTENLSEKEKQKRRRENLLDDATKELNEWTGENTAVEIHLFRMFSEVFKRHDKDEGDALFIVGTKTTTPSLAEVSSAPVKPWLFSRVLALLGISFGLLTLLFLVFHSDKAVPGMVFIGSLAVPFSLAIMFFEINVYKNISVFQATEVFLIGGIASLIATMVLYQIIPSGNGVDLGSALTIGFIEETGKLLIIGYFINSFRLNYIFNGMLVGACVGAGFAVFETSGYTGEFGLITLFVRSWQAIGTHTIWSAIIGAAIILAKERRQPVEGKTMVKPKFLRFYVLAVLLHAAWDWQTPVDFLNAFDIQKWLIIIIGWIAIFVLIDAGLREVRTLQGQHIIN